MRCGVLSETKTIRNEFGLHYAEQQDKLLLFMLEAEAEIMQNYYGIKSLSTLKTTEYFIRTIGTLIKKCYPKTDIFIQKLKKTQIM
jgi:hypothetical protein